MLFSSSRSGLRSRPLAVRRSSSPAVPRLRTSFGRSPVQPPSEPTQSSREPYCHSNPSRWTLEQLLRVGHWHAMVPSLWTATLLTPPNLGHSIVDQQKPGPLPGRAGGRISSHNVRRNWHMSSRSQNSYNRVAVMRLAVLAILFSV